MAPSMATALRDGAATQVNAADIVRGDIVMIHAGDKVCLHWYCF
jgi:magnesium-transporting ATPase (P-type)